MGLLRNVLTGRGVRPEGRDDELTMGENDSTEFRPTDNDVSNHPLFPYWKEITSVDVGDFLGTVEIIGAEARYNQLRITPGAAYDYLAEGESETVEIGYTFRNGWGTWHEATIFLTIEGENDAPDAEDVNVLTTEAAIGDLGTNGITIAPVFTDPDASDTHTIAIESTSGFAFVGVNPDGTIQYYSGAFDYLVGDGETITDTFTYSVTDNHGATDTASVTVTIEGDNDAPVDFVTEAGLSPIFPPNVAGGVFVSEFADGTPEEGGTHMVQGTRAEFFDDVNDTQTISVSFVGSELNNAASTIGALGTVSAVNEQPDPASPRHVYGIDIEVSDTALNFLGEGEVLRQTYDYTITDQHGASATYQFFAYFYGANDAPLASDVIVLESEDWPGGVISTVIFDADVNDTHTYTADTTGTIGSVINNGDGTFTYNSNGAFNSLAVGEEATDSFTYTVDDGNGGTDTATVTLNFTGENDAVVVNPISGSVFEDGPALTLAADFTDPDLSDTHELTVIVSSPQGLISNNLDGTFTYDPNGQFDYLAEGETATETFTYTVFDGTSIASSSLTVTIVGQNDAPELTITDTLEIAENSVAAALIPGTIVDPDATSLTYEIAGGADGALFQIVGGTAIRFSSPQDFENFGDADMDGQYLVDLAVRDDAGAISNTETLIVQLTDVDEGPVPANLLITFDEFAENEAFGGTEYQGFLWSTSGSPLSTGYWDSDGDLEAFSGLTTVAFERADGADFDLNALELGAGDSANGTFVPTFITVRGFNNGTQVHSQLINPVFDGMFQFDMVDVAFNFTGVDRIEIEASDGFFAIDNVDVDVLPLAPNTAPVLDAADLVTIAENETTVAVPSTITDPDLGDTHTFVITGGADFDLFTINGTTGALTFDAAPDFEMPLDDNGDNIYEVNIRVFDSDGAISNTEAVQVQVTDDPAETTPLLLDFEDLGGQILGNGDPFYKGFTWSSPTGFGASDYDTNGDDEITGGLDNFSVERTDGSDFDLTSFDLGEGGFAGDTFFNANFVTVTGMRDGASIGSQTFNAGIDFDNFGMTTVFVGFTDVDQVIFSTDGFYALDNLDTEIVI